MGIEGYKNRCAEAIYDSNQREPLGKSYIRGHTLPEVLPDFFFHTIVTREWIRWGGVALSRIFFESIVCYFALSALSLAFQINTGDEGV